ncbi:MAG TPA: STAS domain-containing protein [Vicinamibacterales bacterium]|nr:STAS domain-containing protein [Vicinamibacterales bacterium]
MPEIQKSFVEPDITVMEVSGRITLGRECQRVEWAIEELIEGKQKKVVLDLSKVTYLDSAGIGISSS